jgi:hypothetical protein
MNQDDFQRVLETVQRLPIEQQRQLVEQLARELEAQESVAPLALSGTWAGVSLTAEEIDEARRECWAGLGGDE